jgi:hypothetical protein
MYHYDHIENSVVTMPGGIGDEEAFIQADTNVHILMLVIWVIFNVRTRTRTDATHSSSFHPCQVGDWLACDVDR